tara:strand:- start:228 stop:1013 length:786 start_codon:yes stop_codon:yes gene_type:complete
MINDRVLLGGSDSVRIMRGEWYQLWAERTGRADPEDLSDKLNVQIGIATETINLNWLEKSIEVDIDRDVAVPPREFLMAHLDGMTKDNDKIPCEAKHTYENNTMENVAATYYAQLQHYMMLTVKPYCYLSVIFGNNKWEHTVIDSDIPYQEKLYKVLSYVWDCIENNKEPTNIDVPSIEPKNIVLDGMKSIDMTTHKHEHLWKSLAKKYNTFKPMAKEFDECKKTIKGLVPDDCRKATGAGIIVTRNKKNILTIKEENDGK